MRSGFTLIETMLCVILLGILTTLAIPIFTQMITRSEVKTESSRLMAVINFARSSAIKMNETISLREKEGEQIVVDSHGQILRVLPTRNSNVTITWHAFPANKDLQFAANGMTVAQNGTFTITDNKKCFSQQVIVNKTGRARIK